MTEATAEAIAEMQQRLDDVLADVAQRQRGLDQVRQSLETAQESSTSANHALTVTVGARGDVVKVHFHGTRYRSMPAAQLEQMIVDEIATARAAMLTRVTEAFQPHVPAGSGLAALMAGGDAGDAGSVFRLPGVGDV
jgi:DNA-binding protein YbaB